MKTIDRRPLPLLIVATTSRRQRRHEQQQSFSLSRATPMATTTARSTRETAEDSSICSLLAHPPRSSVVMNYTNYKEAIPSVSARLPARLLQQQQPMMLSCSRRSTLCKKSKIEKQKTKTETETQLLVGGVRSSSSQRHLVGSAEEEELQPSSTWLCLGHIQQHCLLNDNARLSLLSIALEVLTRHPAGARPCAQRGPSQAERKRQPGPP